MIEESSVVLEPFGSSLTPDTSGFGGPAKRENPARWPPLGQGVRWDFGILNLRSVKDEVTSSPPSPHPTTPAVFSRSQFCPVWYALCVLMLAIVGVHSLSCASVALLDNSLQIEHDAVQSFHGVWPTLLVECNKGFFIVSAAGGRFESFELGNLLLVPENRMMGELGDRICTICGKKGALYLIPALYVWKLLVH